MVIKQALLTRPGQAILFRADTLAESFIETWEKESNRRAQDKLEPQRGHQRRYDAPMLVERQRRMAFMPEEPGNPPLRVAHPPSKCRQAVLFLFLIHGVLFDVCLAGTVAVLSNPSRREKVWITEPTRLELCVTCATAAGSDGGLDGGKSAGGVVGAAGTARVLFSGEHVQKPHRSEERRQVRWRVGGGIRASSRWIMALSGRFEKAGIRRWAAAVVPKQRFPIFSDAFDSGSVIVHERSHPDHNPRALSGLHQ